MKLLSYSGSFLPAKLKSELLAAGVPGSWLEGNISYSLVVQLYEGATPATVQIGVADNQDETLVASVVAAHVPTWPIDPLVVNEQTLSQALATRMDQLRTARNALAAGSIFASLSANEKKTIDALLQDDIQICRLLLGLLDGTG